jgi:glutamine synthetase
MPKLEKMHKEHIALYGEGNEKRLTGLHETSNMNSFNFKVRSRGCSVRIPVYTE